MVETFFSKLPEDVVLNIFYKLEHDPRIWARLACVCTKFSYLIRNVCCKIKCSNFITSVVSDLVSDDSALPGGWAALHKLCVCCPGIQNAGVLLENSGFGFERDIGPDENVPSASSPHASRVATETDVSSAHLGVDCKEGVPGSECSWSLFDDLYYDTVYNLTDSIDTHETQFSDVVNEGVFRAAHPEFPVPKKRRTYRSVSSHLACGTWNLSREQGSKLLARQFRDDCLYICVWPGCVHVEEKRNYMLFRGVFKNFKRSRVWRTINDGNKRTVELGCAFCLCKETWDLHSAFCLRRVYGYHDDGEPVVRALSVRMAMSLVPGRIGRCIPNGSLHLIHKNCIFLVFVSSIPL